MSNPILAALTAQVAENTNVEASAVIALNGVAQRIQDAVAQALENGATSEELAPIQAEIDALNASADALAVAVNQNTGPIDPNQRRR